MKIVCNLKKIDQFFQVFPSVLKTSSETDYGLNFLRGITSYFLNILGFEEELNVSAKVLCRLLSVF